MPDKTTPRMSAGMPLADRQELRAEILETALKRAREQAAEAYLSTRCRGHLEHRDARLSYDQRRAEHVKCLGESMGTGCLCTWHDAELEPIPDTPSEQHPGQPPVTGLMPT